MRRKPLTRETVVAADIIAAERAMEGLLMVESLSHSPGMGEAAVVRESPHVTAQVYRNPHPPRFEEDNVAKRGNRRRLVGIPVAGFRYTLHGR
jgi:hypothetical protein